MRNSKRSYKGCCAAGCVSNTMSNLTFFSLPSDQNRRTEWLQLLRREDIAGKLSSHYRVCEKHFDEDSIILTPTRKVLKKNSTPNRMLPGRNCAPAIHDVVSSLTDLCSNCQASLRETAPLLPQTSRDQPDKKRRKTKNFVFSELCDRLLSENLSRIVKEQIEMGSRPETIHSAEYITFCQRLYHASPAAYDMLRETLCLPANTYLEHTGLPITKQVNYMIEALKPLVAQMTDREKNCSLVVGAIKLKANLFYVAEEDTICGFHEYEESQTNEVAEYAVVAAVQGILGDYQQMVGYALLPATKNEERVFKWIDKLIRQLWDVELNVRVLIADTTYSFLDSANRRRVSIEKPYFIVDNRQIYYMFDPSHLMILMRDTLISYDVYFDEDIVAMWDDIRQLYVRDSARRLRIAPKLTVCHINPRESDKTQAKFAVEVFCATVAAAISLYADLGGRGQNVEGTVRLLTKMNDIAHFFNLSSRYNIQYGNNRSSDIYDVNFLKSTLSFFAKFQVMDKNNTRDVTSLLTCVHSFQITLKSLMFLYNCLEMTSKTFILRTRLNKDYIDNFFDGVKKTVNSTEPTSWQTVTELRKHYLAAFFKSTKLAENSNFDMPNGVPSSLNLTGGKNLEAKKCKIDNFRTSTSAEAQEKNCPSIKQLLNAQTCNLSTNSQINDVIKQEIETDTDTLDFGENSNFYHTVAIKQEVVDSIVEEEEHDDLIDTAKIKKEREDFLAMEFEIEENALRTPIYTNNENYCEFPKTIKSTFRQNSDLLQPNFTGQVPEKTLNNGCTNIEDTTGHSSHSVKRKQENKLEVKIEHKAENSSSSQLMADVQTNMITLVNNMKTKRKRFLSPVLSENVQDIDFNSLCLSESNMLLTICGLLLGKIMEQHPHCDDLKTYALVTHNPVVRRFTRYHYFLEKGGKQLLNAPPDNFIEYIEELDSIFCGFFKTRQNSHTTIMQKTNTVIQNLLKNCRNVSFLRPCECFPEKYTKVLFYRVRLHVTLEHNNRIYDQCRDQPQFVIPPLQCLV